jgi:disulfide bond formation protein DsbB
VLWRFLGLSIAEWALVWFFIFTAAAIVAAAMKFAPPRPAA